MGLDDGSLSVRVECVLYTYRYILNANGVYRRRINHLCTKVAKLHSLDIAQFVDSVCSLDYSWIGGHEAVYIGPYFEYVGIECCRNDSCCIVGTSASEVGYLVGVAVHTDKTWNKRNAWQVAECATHQSVGEF